MIKIRNKIDLIGSVLDIVLNDGEYLLVDNNHRIYRFSLKDFIFSFSKKIYKDTPPHHLYSKAMSCSADGYALVPKVRNPLGWVYKIQDGHIFLSTRLKWHHADISVSKFSQDFKYLASGGEDGRVFIYTHPNYRLNTFLPRRPDYISSIVFSKDSQYIAYASYDLTLTIYSLKDDAILITTTTPSTIEDMTFFAKDSKIFYACRNGETGIFNIAKNINKYNKTLLFWPTRVLLESDENFAYIGTRDDVLYIYSLKENIQAHQIRLSSKGITCMKEYENCIFVCFANGKIQIIDKFYKIDEFLALLNQKDFIQAKKFAEENNVLLKVLKVYTQIKDSNWQMILKQVIKLLLDDKITEILELTTPYFEDSKKEEEIKKYIVERSFIQEFIKAFEEKEYGKACEIASNNPFIKKLSEYQKIEEYFDKVCDISKYLVFQDPAVSKEKISTLLEPFKNVPEKKVEIITILNNWDKYILAEQYAKEGDFTNYFALVIQCGYLKKSKTYQKVYLECENLTRQIQELISKKDYSQAQQKLEILNGVEPFSEFVTKNQNYLNNIDLFLSSINAKNYQECYRMIQEYPELGSSEEAGLLYEEILKIFEKAKGFAQRGDTKQTYLEIHKFFGIESWNNKVNITMKIAYLYEMQEALKKSSEIDWEKTIEEYISRYGKDDEIIAFCNRDESFSNILESIPNIPKKSKKENINHIQSIIFTKEIQKVE